MYPPIPSLSYRSAQILNQRGHLSRCSRLPRNEGRTEVLKENPGKHPKNRYLRPKNRRLVHRPCLVTFPTRVHRLAPSTLIRCLEVVFLPVDLIIPPARRQETQRQTRTRKKARHHSYHSHIASRPPGPPAQTQVLRSGHPQERPGQSRLI